MSEKILIFIPTYNEKTNVKIILEKILSLGLDLYILFLDDDSPDGTGQVLDEIASKHYFVKIIHRKVIEKGIGSAHIDGIKYAYNKNYDYLITMDCDLSHSPSYIPDFIEKKNQADLIIGTRFKNKKSIETWNIYRKLLTNLGHIASFILLGIRFDSTGAFRIYNLKVINQDFLNLIAFKRYSFFFESLYILNYNNYKIIEIPINLPSRVYGNSKQKLRDVFLGMKNLLSVFFIRIFNRKRYKIKNK